MMTKKKKERKILFQFREDIKFETNNSDQKLREIIFDDYIPFWIVIILVNIVDQFKSKLYFVHKVTR